MINHHNRVAKKLQWILILRSVMNFLFKNYFQVIWFLHFVFDADNTPGEVFELHVCFDPDNKEKIFQKFIYESEQSRELSFIEIA